MADTKEGFVYYRSFAEGLIGLDDATYRRLNDAILWYALDGREPNLTGLEKSLFLAWKANVDANFKRQENGAKGGAPVGNNNASKQRKQPKTTEVVSETSMVESKQPTETYTETETKTKTETKTEKPPKHKHGRNSRVLLTDEEYQKLIAEYGEEKAKAAIDYLDEYIVRNNYKRQEHYLCIRKWVFDAMREEEIKQRELQQREQRLNNQYQSPKPQQGITRDGDPDADVMKHITTARQRNGPPEDLSWMRAYS